MRVMVDREWETVEPVGNIGVVILEDFCGCYD
jgi:hypothetical protein